MFSIPWSADLFNCSPSTLSNEFFMSIRQWYSTLFEDKVLTFPANDVFSLILLAVRADTLSPLKNWPHTWRLASLKGLKRDLSSFLFKILHRLKIWSSDWAWEIAGLSQTEIKEPLKAFLVCSFSRGAGLCLLCLVKELCPQKNRAPPPCLHWIQATPMCSRNCLSQAVDIERIPPNCPHL